MKSLTQEGNVIITATYLYLQMERIYTLFYIADLVRAAPKRYLRHAKLKTLLTLLTLSLA